MFRIESRLTDQILLFLPLASLRRYKDDGLERELKLKTRRDHNHGDGQTT